MRTELIPGVSSDSCYAIFGMQRVPTISSFFIFFGRGVVLVRSGFEKTTVFVKQLNRSPLRIVSLKLFSK